MKFSRISLCLLLCGLGLQVTQTPASAESRKIPKHCRQSATAPNQHVVVAEPFVSHELCVASEPFAMHGSVEMYDSIAVGQQFGLPPALYGHTSQFAAKQSLVLSPAAMTVSNQTFLIVNCPSEAEVRIGNYLTRSSGPSRLFRLSLDQPQFHRVVTISMTKNEVGNVYKYEKAEVIDIQPGRTTTLTLKKSDLHRTRICDPDCKTSDEANSSSADKSAGAVDRNAQLIEQLRLKVGPGAALEAVKWEIASQSITMNLETLNKAQEKASAALSKYKNLQRQIHETEDAAAHLMDEVVRLQAKAKNMSPQDDTGRRNLETLADEKRVEANDHVRKVARLRAAFGDARIESDAAETSRKDAQVALDDSVKRLKVTIP